MNYKEPRVLTTEFVDAMLIGTNILVLMSFLYFEAPSQVQCDLRANHSIFIRRYSTLAWFGVGRNYLTSAFVRLFFGT